MGAADELFQTLSPDRITNPEPSTSKSRGTGPAVIEPPRGSYSLLFPLGLIFAVLSLSTHKTAVLHRLPFFSPVLDVKSRAENVRVLRDVPRGGQTTACEGGCRGGN